MTEEKRIYINDRNVPYKETTISPIDSKRDIDGALAKWGVKKVAWDFDFDKVNGFVEVTFQVKEIVKGEVVYPIVMIRCPRIWRKVRGKNKPDTIKWNTSMRILFWYMKTHLEHAYLMEDSSITVEFLPYVTTPKLQSKGMTMKDYVLPRLTQNSLPFLE